VHKQSKKSFFLSANLPQSWHCQQVDNITITMAISDKHLNMARTGTSFSKYKNLKNQSFAKT
jgi:hypothetical protein